MDELTLAVAPNPFVLGREVRRVPVGATVEEIVRAAGVEPELAHVEIEGEYVAREWMPRVRPKTGTVLTVRAVPQGGRAGKAILTIILGIGLITLAVALGPLIGASIAGIGPLSGLAAAGVGAAGVLAIGSGIYSLLTPPPDPAETPAGTNKTLGTFANNSYDLYKPVIRNYGRNLIYGRWAGKPYTRVDGGDTPYRVGLLHFGYGPNKVESLRRGEADFDKLPVRWNVYEGWDDDTAELEFYTRSVDEESVGTEVDEDNTDWQIRNTQADTRSAYWLFQFGGGLVYYADNRTKWVEIELAVEYRVAGSADPWTPAAIINRNDNVRQSTPGTVYLRGEETGAAVRAFGVDFGSRGTWETRWRRVSRRAETGSDNPDKFRDLMVWSIFQSVRPAQKPNVPNLTLVEFEYDLSNERGNVDRINAIVTSYLPTWDDVIGWGDPTRVSTNPKFSLQRRAAWAFAENLRGPQNPSPVGDDRIDGEQLLAWATRDQNDSRTFRAVVDGTQDGGGATVFQVAKNIARAGRADFTIVDGNYSVILNEPKPTRVQTFSPRNIANLRVDRSFRKQVQGYNVTFIDPEQNYRVAERRVYAEGFDETTATTLSDLDLTFGVDSADIAYVDAKMHEASVKLQPRVVSFEVDAENLVAVRGDRVGVQHDAMLAGLGSGRIKTLNVVADEIVSFTTDVTLNYEDVSIQYGAIIRASDGQHYSGQVAQQTQESQFRTVEFLSPVPINTGAGYAGPIVGDLFNFGEFGKVDLDMEIISVLPTRLLAARLECIDYNEAIFEADTQPIPDYDPNITVPVPIGNEPPPKPSIVQVLANEEVLRSTGITAMPDVGIGVWFTVANSDKAPAAFVEIATQLVYADDGLLDVWRTGGSAEASSGFVSALGLQEGKTYHIRVRSVTESGVASDWVSRNSIKVIGLSTPPPDPTDPRIESESFFVWGYPDDPPPDFIGFKVRYQIGTAVDWETGIEIAGLITTQVFDPRAYSVPSGQITVMVRAVDAQGNLSTGLVSGLLTVAETFETGVVRVEDHRVGEVSPWDYGIKGNLTVDASDNNYLKADLQSLTDPFWPEDLRTPFWPVDLSTSFWDVLYKQASYLYTFQPDLKTPYVWPAWLEAEVVAAGAGVDVRYAFDIAGPYFPIPDRIPIEDSSSQSVVFAVGFQDGRDRGVLQDLKINFRREIQRFTVRFFMATNPDQVPYPSGVTLQNVSAAQVTIVNNQGDNERVAFASLNDPSPGDVTITTYSGGSTAGGAGIEVVVTVEGA